jgi:Domain of unknown function (DUF4157)
MTMTYAGRDGRSHPPPTGVLRCPGFSPSCPCHDERAVALPAQIAGTPGRPLDVGVQQHMERAFSHDFSRVRVHADQQAAASARNLDALAYSIGPHIVFGADQYAPGTLAGRRLIAHELAHVVQQDTPAAGAAGHAPAAGTTLEEDANQAASAATAGRAPQVRQHAAAGAAFRQAAAPTPTAPTTAPATQQGTQPQPPSPLPAVQHGANVGPHGNLDAEFSRPNALLTVQVRVKFRKDDSIKPWPRGAAFERFVAKFIETVMRRWSFRHFLAPVGNAPGEPQRVAVRVQLLQVTSGEQLTANVRYTDKTFEQSSYNVATRTAQLDVLDIEQRLDIPQTPAEHEFGHVLGLQHPICDGNEDRCYGALREDTSDVRGRGSFVSPRDYEIFAGILTNLTGKQWRVQQASYIPTSSLPVIGAALGVGFGALAGGLAGALIGSLAGPVGIAIGAAIGAIAGAVGGYFAGRAIGTSAARTETQPVPR